VFNVVDDDLCEPDFDVHARSTHILRRIEHKFPGRGLSRSQRDVYPLYSEALHGLAARGRIDERSGVFVVECDIPPVDGGAIERVQWNGALAERHHLDARELGWFLRGRPARSRDGVPV
jgi:hypothetical protein